MASTTISSSDRRLLISKRRLNKPLMLRDYLFDDLSSSSSNGFKSFPRLQCPSSSSSSTVRRLLDAEIKRSGFINHHHHHKPPRLTRRSRTTCGTAISHAVYKASTAFLNAVKILPFPSSTVVKTGDNTNNKQGVFSGRRFSKRLFSRSFWRKPVGKSRREGGEIQWWRSVAYEESLDQRPSDLMISQISSTTVDDKDEAISLTATATVEDIIYGESSSSGSEFFTNSIEDVVQSSSSSFSSLSSSESEEASNENDAVKDRNETGESLNARDCDGSSVNCNSLSDRQECVNEEKEQLSPVSILECPFEDDEDGDEDHAITDLISHQNDTYEKIERRSRRSGGLIRLEPLDLERRVETYVERQEEYSYHTLETEENKSENRANRLFDLVKSRIGKTDNLLASNVADSRLLLDYLQENNTKEEALMVKEVEDWVMGAQEEMFMSWEVIEKREVYVKQMQWGCINGDERESVVKDLANDFFSFLVDEVIFDFDS